VIPFYVAGRPATGTESLTVRHPFDTEVVGETSNATPAQVEEEKEKPFQPVKVDDKPKGILDSIRVKAGALMKKVQQLLKPEKKIHKEVIINAENLETRVEISAVVEQ